uniref:Uncharacterized protein n=3 Tax=Magallana TaxID=2171616 RepID=A0A8W8KR28_MAGGI
MTTVLPRNQLIPGHCSSSEAVLFGTPHRRILSRKMKTILLCTFVVAALIGALRAEDCTVVGGCIDTVCNHHTNLECVHGICTCSLPPYDIHCLDKGDCDRHSYTCTTEWKCINQKCRCDN